MDEVKKRNVSKENKRSDLKLSPIKINYILNYIERRTKLSYTIVYLETF